MNSFNISPTEYSPSVTYNPVTKTFVFAGESRPENSGKFYEPIITWLINFEGELKENIITTKESPLLFIFKFDYFNSSSARYIMNILQIVKKIVDNKNNYVKVEWYYEKLDEDMLEAGKEFSEAIDFNFYFNEM